MQWSGEGLLIGTRRFGETSVIAEVMVAGRGRALGLVRGGRSPRLASTLQPGNRVRVVWRARLEEHLGAFAIELVTARAAELIAARQRLYACQLLCEHLRLLAERDPHDRLLTLAEAVLTTPPGLTLTVALARFELALLDELGFGLDLSHCALTGVSDDLAYVSPKTGRAVSRHAAQPYRDRLLALPAFLCGGELASAADLADAFRLTGHFLERHVWEPRRLAPPATREALVADVDRL